MTDKSQDNAVLAYCKSERQWPRKMRVSHAQYQLKMAKSNADRLFWGSVLKKNEVVNDR